jgi:hypothetical protein
MGKLLAGMMILRALLWETNQLNKVNPKITGKGFMFIPHLVQEVRAMSTAGLELHPLDETKACNQWH